MLEGLETRTAGGTVWGTDVVVAPVQDGELEIGQQSGAEKTGQVQDKSTEVTR